jgi:hypothetical protein
MSNESTDELSRYAQVNSLMLDTYGEKCLDISYADMIKDLRETSWSSSAAEGGKVAASFLTSISFEHNSRLI